MAEKVPPKTPDRPYECGECKKPIKVLYTEIIGNNITSRSMCGDCPELQKRLHGMAYQGQGLINEPGAGLACGNCGTTLSAVRMGTPMGCNVCYEIFGDVILAEIQNSKGIPSWINLTKKSQPIHIGRAPGESQEINPSMRLLALNEALSETLKREDYEQAALLRDQIKALTDQQQPENTNPEKREKKENER